MHLDLGLLFEPVVGEPFAARRHSVGLAVAETLRPVGLAAPRRLAGQAAMRRRQRRLALLPVVVVQTLAVLLPDLIASYRFSAADVERVDRLCLAYRAAQCLAYSLLRSPFLLTADCSVRSSDCYLWFVVSALMRIEYVGYCFMSAEYVRPVADHVGAGEVARDAVGSESEFQFAGRAGAACVLAAASTRQAGAAPSRASLCDSTVLESAPVPRKNAAQGPRARADRVTWNSTMWRTLSR